MTTSLGFILSSATKYEGLVKEWRRRELKNKRPQAATRSRRGKSRRSSPSPVPLAESVNYYANYANRKIAEWLSADYLDASQHSQGLNFAELAQYMFDIGFSRGLEDEALILTIYLMFLNRLKDGAFGNVSPHTEDLEAFSQTRISIQDVQVLLHCIMDLPNERLMKDYFLANRQPRDKHIAS